MRNKYFAIVLIIFSTNSSEAAQYIDVLVGAAPEAVDIQNAFTAASDLAVQMTLVMTSNGMLC